MTKTHIVRREEELLALLSPQFGFHLLGQFVQPTTASEAARRLGESASKVSYHVGKLQNLGLLEPAGNGEGRGQHLQARAQRFVLDPALLPALDSETVRPMLTALTEAFLAASAQAEPDPAREYVLMDLTPDAAHSLAPDWKTERRGVLVQQFRLPRERYAALMTELQERLQREADTGAKAERDQWHTVALLGFPGTMLPLAEK
ncbi:helix-turn-helix domain-containing protein [Deinococcus wulumuqiensis]